MPIKTVGLLFRLRKQVIKTTFEWKPDCTLITIISKFGHKKNWSTLWQLGGRKSNGFKGNVHQMKWAKRHRDRVSMSKICFWLFCMSEFVVDDVVWRVASKKRSSTTRVHCSLLGFSLHFYLFFPGKTSRLKWNRWKKMCWEAECKREKKDEEAMRLMVEEYEKWMNYVFVGVGEQRVAVWMWKAISAN